MALCILIAIGEALLDALVGVKKVANLAGLIRTRVVLINTVLYTDICGADLGGIDAREGQGGRSELVENRDFSWRSNIVDERVDAVENFGS